MTGTFDRWTKSVKLEKQDDVFQKSVELEDASEKIYYKVRCAEVRRLRLCLGSIFFFARSFPIPKHPSMMMPLSLHPVGFLWRPHGSSKLLLPCRCFLCCCCPSAAPQNKIECTSMHRWALVPPLQSLASLASLVPDH